MKGHLHEVGSEFNSDPETKERPLINLTHGEELFHTFNTGG